MRINISVDARTIRLADRLARRRKISRSAVLRQGVQALAENQMREAEEKALRESRRQAANDMDRLARKFGDWPAERILREARDRWSPPRREP